MNTRKMTLVLAVVAATSALSSQAADYFEQQRQITDGYVAEFPVQPTSARTKPETPMQAAQNDFLARERIYTVTPVPFVPPKAAALVTNSRAATARQTAENNWLTQERNEEDGNAVPVPFVSSR